MGTFKDLVAVVLIFLCITATIFPADLHTILVYLFKCNVPEYEGDLMRPYYLVTGVITGLTAVYLSS